MTSKELEGVSVIIAGTITFILIGIALWKVLFPKSDTATVVLPNGKTIKIVVHKGMNSWDNDEWYIESKSWNMFQELTDSEYKELQELVGGVCMAVRLKPFVDSAKKIKINLEV